MSHARQDRRRLSTDAPRGVDGFTLIEILVVLTLIGLITSMLVPNLGAFVPRAKLDAAAKILTANIDFLRSEARIQGKRYALELDLDRGSWRRVFPPEDRLTTEQDVQSLEPRHEEWTRLQDGVRILTAGNGNEGMAKGGTFALTFDHNGQTGDQTIVLQLADDASMTWTVNVRGLTGQCDIIESFDGKQHLPEETTEGSF